MPLNSVIIITYLEVNCNFPHALHEAYLKPGGRFLIVLTRVWSTLVLPLVKVLDRITPPS